MPDKPTPLSVSDAILDEMSDEQSRVDVVAQEGSPEGASGSTTQTTAIARRPNAFSDAEYRAALRHLLLSWAPVDEDLPPSIPGLQVLGVMQDLRRVEATDPDGPVRRTLEFWSRPGDLFFGWVRPIHEAMDVRVVEARDAEGVDVAVLDGGLFFKGYVDFGCPTKEKPASIVVEALREDPPPFVNFVMWGLSRAQLEAYTGWDREPYLVRPRSSTAEASEEDPCDHMSDDCTCGPDEP